MTYDPVDVEFTSGQCARVKRWHQAVLLAGTTTCLRAALAVTISYVFFLTLVG